MNGSSPDPFEHFEEQQLSHELVAEHREALIADAAEFARQHPDLELVGLILEAGASEAAPLRAALEQATGQSFAGRGFLGVVPRSMVLAILRANAPATLDWLPPSRTGSTRTLPIAVVTKSGFRFAAVSYQTPEP